MRWFLKKYMTEFHWVITYFVIIRILHEVFGISPLGFYILHFLVTMPFMLSSYLRNWLFEHDHDEEK